MQYQAQEYYQKKSCLEPIYVVGFPKSGNTWLARMIAQAIDANISAKDNINTADNNINRTGKYIIHKKHFSDHYEHDIHVRDARIVYIVRDIRDVLVSGFFSNHKKLSESKVYIKNHAYFTRMYFEYFIISLCKRWHGSPLADTRRFINKLAGRAKGSGVGNWSRHVDYWTSIPGVVTVRYEDLLKQPVLELNRVVTELKLSNDIAHPVEIVVEDQSFERKREEFVSSGDHRNAIFLRSGKAGDWERFLSPYLLDRIMSEHRQVMMRMGYM